MSDILDILKYILPSGIVFATAYYLIRLYLANDHKKNVLQLQQQNKNLTTPLRMQAYERILVLLERTSPASLLLRVIKPGQSALQLQHELVQNIRNEFDHNVSQQLYVSSAAWDLAKNAREETVKLINLAASGLQPGAQAADLAARILELTAKTIPSPIQLAVEFLKTEARSHF